MKTNPFQYQIIFSCGMIWGGDLKVTSLAAIDLSRNFCPAHTGCFREKLIIGGEEVRIKTDIEYSKILIKAALAQGTIKNVSEIVQITKAICALDKSPGIKLLHTAEACSYRSIAYMKEEIENFKAKDDSTNADLIDRMCAILEIVDDLNTKATKQTKG